MYSAKNSWDRLKARRPLTFQQEDGLLAEDLDERVIQLHLLQPGDELLLAAAHLLLGVEAFRHVPLLPETQESRLHRQRQTRLALLWGAAWRQQLKLRPLRLGNTVWGNTGYNKYSNKVFLRFLSLWFFW